MSSITDRDYVREQYATSANLNARSQLHARFSVNGYGWFRWVYDQIAWPGVRRVLELGCGDGALWLSQGARLPQGARVLLTDLSSGMAREAAAALGADARFAFAQADAQAIPCADASCEVALAHHMLYHVPRHELALREIQRVLRPGGWLYASTVGRNHLRELDELVHVVAPGADPWGGRRPNTFLLQEAAAELRTFFAQVEPRLYEDALVVTEIEPLVAYVLSTSAREAVLARLADFVALIERRLASDGAIRITKETGLFACQRAAT